MRLNLKHLKEKNPELYQQVLDQLSGTTPDKITPRTFPNALFNLISEKEIIEYLIQQLDLLFNSKNEELFLKYSEFSKEEQQELSLAVLNRLRSTVRLRPRKVKESEKSNQQQEDPDF